MLILLAAAIITFYASSIIKRYSLLTIFLLKAVNTPKLLPFLFLQLCFIHLLLLLTILLLINNFSFLYFNVNLVNIAVNFKTLTYLNFILLYSSAWGLIGHAHILIPFALTFSYPLYLLNVVSARSPFYWKSRLIGVTHFLILLLVFISYLLSSKVFLYWSESNWGFKSLLAGSKFTTYTYTPLLQLNTSLIEYQLLTTEPIIYDYNYSSSAGNNKIFSLSLSTYLGLQQLISGEHGALFISTMYDPFLFPMSFTILFLSYFTFLLIKINFTLEK
jgi:hypothetical protein